MILITHYDWIFIISIKEQGSLTSVKDAATSTILTVRHSESSKYQAHEDVNMDAPITQLH